MASKKTDKPGLAPKPARIRKCAHCDEKVPADQLVAKLVIDFEGDRRSKRTVRVIKGH